MQQWTFEKSNNNSKPVPKPRSSRNGLVLTPVSPGMPERTAAEIVAEHQSGDSHKPTPPPRQKEQKQALLPSQEAILRRSGELSVKRSSMTESSPTMSTSMQGEDAAGETTLMSPPPLPPRKVPDPSFDFVPRSPIELQHNISGSVENPMYMSRDETTEQTCAKETSPLNFTEEDFQYLTTTSKFRDWNWNDPGCSVSEVPSTDSREVESQSHGDPVERPSYASSISLDDSSRDSRFSSFTEILAPDRTIDRRSISPVAQNICLSGWVLMKILNKKEIKEKDYTEWFCILKDSTLSFRHNDTDNKAPEFSYPCSKISFIGRECSGEEPDQSEKAAFYLVINASQKVLHLRILADQNMRDTWILLIAKSCSPSDYVLELLQTVERAGPLNIKQGTTGNEQNILEHDIRKILSIKSQVSDKSQWCPVPVSSKVGPFLVAFGGSSLHIQSSHDLVTQCWKEALDAELKAESNVLENQRLTTKDVPHLVEKCINFISTFGLSEKGIHRLSGTASKVRQLMEEFRKDPAGVEIRCEDYSVHDVASALRKFLRSLEEPLFTRRLKADFLKCYHLPESDIFKKNEAYEALLGTMELEHRVNYATLRKLFGHLKEVTDNCGVNSMTVSNVAAIFGPSLFSVDNDMDHFAYGSTQYEIQVVGDLVSNFYQIFHVSMKEVDDKVIFGKIAGSEPKVYAVFSVPVLAAPGEKSQAGGLLIPIHMFEYDNQAFNIQDNKTADEVCSFAIHHQKLPEKDGPYALFEVVREGKLERMVFSDERLIEIAVNRWQGWTDIDKSGNYLVIKKDFVRKRLESVTPYPFVTEVSFADVGSKTFRKAAFQCIKGEICYYKNSKCAHLVKKWPVENVLWFFGAETKRDVCSNRSLTFVEKDTRPTGKFLGMCMCFKDEGDMYRWLASVLLVQRAL